MEKWNRRIAVEQLRLDRSDFLQFFVRPFTVHTLECRLLLSLAECGVKQTPRTQAHARHRHIEKDERFPDLSRSNGLCALQLVNTLWIKHSNKRILFIILLSLMSLILVGLMRLNFVNGTHVCAVNHLRYLSAHASNNAYRSARPTGHDGKSI